MSRPVNIDHYMATKGTTCAYCEYGRHKYKKGSPAPEQCKDCYWSSYRDDPYMRLIPVWKEGHVPTKDENAKAFADIRKILAAAPDCYYPDYKDGITGKE